MLNGFCDTDSRIVAVDGSRQSKVDVVVLEVGQQLVELPCGDSFSESAKRLVRVIIADKGVQLAFR